MTTYQPGIPTGTVNLDVDYQNIQNNFQQLDTTYGTDHIAYSQAENNGYHNIIRLVPNSAPAPITGIGQILNNITNDNINTDTALYYLTAANRLILFTRNFAPGINSNGSTFLPGGLILRWGFVDGTHASAPANHFVGGDTGTVNFATVSPNNPAFPTACFSVWTSLSFTAGSPPASSTNGTVSVQTNFSGASFNWSYNGTSASYTRFFWYAIGV